MDLSLRELEILIDAVGCLLSEFGDRDGREDLLARLREARAELEEAR